jgi:hypothetical protein
LIHQGLIFQSLRIIYFFINHWLWSTETHAHTRHNTNPSTMVIIWENVLIECNHMCQCQKLTHVRHTFCTGVCGIETFFFFLLQRGPGKRDYITTKWGVAIPKTSATNKWLDWVGHVSKNITFESKEQPRLAKASGHWFAFW